MALPPRADIGHFAFKEHAPTQNALFSEEELLIPESVFQLRKAVSVIHSYPTPGSKPHTLNTRKLLDGCILAAQLDIKRRKDITIERIRDERITPIFEVKLSELGDLSGVKARPKQIYAVLEELFEKVFHWNVLNEDSTVVYKSKAHFLTMLGDGQNHKTGWVCFSMDPTILSMVLEPSTWATLSMEVLRSLPNKCAHALYTNTYRYINTDKKVTAQLSLETWIDLLVGSSRYVKTEADGRVTINYKDFKRYVLVPAIEVINAHPALNYALQLHERKSGSKVVALQFSFVKKQQSSLDLPISWGEDIISVLRSMGFSDEDISNMSQAHNQVELAEALSRMSEAEKHIKESGRKISSRRSYFAGILNNVHKEFEPSAEAIKMAEAANLKAAEEEIERRKTLAETRFKEHQAERYAQAFFELEEQERDELIKAFTESSSGKNIVADRFIKSGWKPENKPLMSLLRDWAKSVKPELEGRLLSEPQDQNIEAWKDWKLSNST